MKIGVFAAMVSPTCTPALMEEQTRCLEEVGVHSLWLGEHVVLFDEMEFGYPGSADGKIPVPSGGGLLDTVASIAFLAHATSTIRLGTGVALVSQREPLYTANEFATLDWLSGGRIDFGIGVGWCKEEVVSTGHTWGDRGARSDEFLEVVSKLWTEELVTYDGDHFSLPHPLRLDPKPVQDGGVPIVVGGHSDAALRRTARFGSGWYGFGLTPDQTGRLLGRLGAELDGVGRSINDVQIVLTPAAAAPDDLERFAALGVDSLVLPLGSRRPERFEARLGELTECISRYDN